MKNFLWGSLLSSLILLNSQTIAPNTLSTPTEIIRTTCSNTLVQNWTATAYWAGSCGKKLTSRGYGTTASGYSLYNRKLKQHKPWNKAWTVAAPASIPLGTKLKITFSAPNQKYSGIYTVRDRGGAIKGHLLDIYLDSAAKCKAFGRQKIKVEVIK